VADDQKTGFVFSDDDKKQLTQGAQAPASGGTFTFSDAEKKQYGQPSNAAAVERYVNANKIPSYYGFTPSNAWKNLKELGSDTVDAAKYVLNPPLTPEQQKQGEFGKELSRWKNIGDKFLFEPADREKYKSDIAYQEGRTGEGIGHGIAAGLPIIGPFVANLAEQAGTGDVGGAATKGAGAYVGGKVGGKVLDKSMELGGKTLAKTGEMAGRVAGGESPTTVVRDTVGDAIRDPETGELKPVPKHLAHAGGALVGGKLGALTGMPEAALYGAWRGGALGPSLMERMFPARAVAAEPPSLGTPKASELPTGDLPEGNPTPFAKPKTASTQTPRAPRASRSVLDTEAAERLQKESAAEPETQPTEESKPKVNTEKAAEDIAKQVTGWQPLEKNVPLKDQFKGGATTEDPMVKKYPDPAQRQMVRANGKGIVQAIGNDASLMKQVHNLTRVDLRQALINAGEDLGQTTVSDSKFAGEGSITRQQAFDKLLQKGVSPQEIVRLAKERNPGAQPKPQ
jgi:hypothetical protein